jgi:hypothetical protein
MRIDGLPEQPKVSQANQRNTAARPNKEGARPADSVEISRDAFELAGLTKLAKAASEDFNPRLREIRERIDSGFYDTREAREKIADAVLQSDGVRVVVDDIDQFRAALEKLAEVPDIREDAVATARSKVASGAFDTREALVNTAQRMIDEMA